MVTIGIVLALLFVVAAVALLYPFVQSLLNERDAIPRVQPPDDQRPADDTRRQRDEEG